MVNNNPTLSITATYNEHRHKFECTKEDFLIKAAEKFNIDDILNVDLYYRESGKKTRILQRDITDRMTIEIADKRTIRNGQQRTTESAVLIQTENIVTKLIKNTTLSGDERQNLIDFLDKFPTVVSNYKRKFDDVSNQRRLNDVSNKRKFDEISPEPKKFHKKVQVNMPSMNSKDYSTQTDNITLPALQEGVIAEEQITDKMKKLVSKPNANRQEVAKLMADSFDERRIFIRMKSPPVSNLKEKYPFLFDLNEVKNELGRIFYSEKPQEFIDNMYKYAPFIVQKCKSDDLKRRTKKSMEKCPTNLQKKYAEVVGSVFILTDLMEEEWRFIHLQDFPSGSDDIYPHIDASCHKFNEVFFDGSLYDIKVEGLKLCDATNFLEAILCLVAAFFIFNIDYPPACRRTMIMFEKLYLKANDTEDIDEHTSQMVKLLEFEGRAHDRN